MNDYDLIYRAVKDDIKPVSVTAENKDKAIAKVELLPDCLWVINCYKTKENGNEWE